MVTYKIEKGLLDEFERLRNINYNQNTKGADHEKVLSSFLLKYLNGAFNFLVC